MAEEDPSFKPPALKNKVTVWRHLQWVWDAFLVLSNARPIGMDVGRIPVSEVKAYADLIGINAPDERAQFLTLISRMDGAWMAHRAKRSPKT